MNMEFFGEEFLVKRDNPTLVLSMYWKWPEKLFSGKLTQVQLVYTPILTRLYNVYVCIFIGLVRTETSKNTAQPVLSARNVRDKEDQLDGPYIQLPLLISHWD